MERSRQKKWQRRPDHRNPGLWHLHNVSSPYRQMQICAILLSRDLQRKLSFLYACVFETGSRGNARTVATKNPIRLASPAIFLADISSPSPSPFFLLFFSQSVQRLPRVHEPLDRYAEKPFEGTRPLWAVSASPETVKTLLENGGEWSEMDGRVKC